MRETITESASSSITNTSGSTEREKQTPIISRETTNALGRLQEKLVPKKGKKYLAGFRKKIQMTFAYFAMSVLLRKGLTYRASI